MIEERRETGNDGRQRKYGTYFYIYNLKVSVVLYYFYSTLIVKEKNHIFIINDTFYNKVPHSSVSLIGECPENDCIKAEKNKNKQTAEEVLKLALDGEDFASLAKEFSDDSSASSGGDLGYFTGDDMVSSFSKAAFSLKNGEIYPEVVETTSGYHIIKKTGEKQQAFDDVKDDLITTLKNTKQTTLMQDLYSKYNVDIKN